MRYFFKMDMLYGGVGSYLMYITFHCFFEILYVITKAFTNVMVCIMNVVALHLF